MISVGIVACSPSLVVDDDGGVDDGGESDGDADGDSDGDGDGDADGDGDGDSDGDADGDADGDIGRVDCESEETCHDGLDNDCDGRVDEDCVCQAGEVADCFSGNPRQRGVGACRDGEMICAGSYEFGEWSACVGEVLPTVEVCDEAGVDEDCDGASNDGCECTEGDPELPCGSDVGACERGVQACEDGQWSECRGGVEPRAESCNGVDDDCDGAVDEHLIRACGSDEGACSAGREVCTDGAWGECLDAQGPAEEVCDGLDNDCDGEVDEELTRPCGTDEGRCVAGVEVCRDGVYGACEGSVGPTTDECNNVDDDCDGEVDEELTHACGTDMGLCSSGLETCAAGTWGDCLGAVWPTVEVCDGVRDENCDGTVDEGCGCTSGDTRSCGTDVGICSTGTQICDSSGSWGACLGARDAEPESCNGLDDDCDGVSDEGCDCITGETRSCGSDEGVCELGVETCSASGHWGPCLGAVEPSSEVCNDLDDDCDGLVDEGDICPRFDPTVLCPGRGSVTLGDSLTLDGEGEDPDGGSVEFAWSVVTAPTGSAAAPTPANAATTTFTPDQSGDYLLRLCVTDDESATACCTTSITAAPACTPPEVPVLGSCPTSWDRRPVLEFTPLPSEQFYEIWVSGDADPLEVVTLEGQNYSRPASAIAAGGPPPGDVVELWLRACRSDEPSCCSTSLAIEVALIERCDTPIPATSENVIFSEYATNGDGPCPGDDCEAGEAIEITNLSHCPVTLDGTHFAYCNGTCSTYRWMNFGPTDIIPPRGVYVAIRNLAGSTCEYPFFGPDDPELFGLMVSGLEMESASSLATGWFNNSGGTSSRLRIAEGAWVDIDSGETIELISPYLGSAGHCESIGFDAIDECGNISAVASPSEVLAPNQLGRLWHPCDAVVDPYPADCM